MRGRSRRGAAQIARPLLGIPKARLIATLRTRQLPFVEDPSNADRRFERVRWRALAPLLADPLAGVIGFHLYTFNAVDATEAWRQGMLDGSR